MKKMLTLMALCLLACGQMMAQDESKSENREAKRAELIAKSGERLAKTFGLESAARDSFLAVYTQYQTEMFGTNARTDKREAKTDKEGEDKKELTDAQATERIEANFKKQEAQVEQLRARLDIQKRYYARFQQMLTPAQTLKAMFPQRPRPLGGGQQGGQGNRRGGFGGPGGRGGFGGPEGF